jgi:hypothetical protein
MRVYFVVVFALLSLVCQAQKEDKVLQQKLQQLVKGFKGDSGI